MRTRPIPLSPLVVPYDDLHALRNELHIVSGKLQVSQERHAALFDALDALVVLMRAAHSNWADRLAAEVAKHREGR